MGERLFVAAWPPPDVLDVIAAVARPEGPGLRWTRRDQWHVTLRFLGSVEDRDQVVAAVAGAAAGAAPVVASLGPAVRTLGRGVVVLPVGGLEPVARTVVAATAGLGQPPPDRPFRGHVTLARRRPGAPLPTGVVGTEVAATWPVHEVVVVRSTVAPAGSRYEVVARAPLAG